MAELAVLYDADCRFCRATLGLLLTWDRRRRLRPVALQSAEAESLLPGQTADQRLASLHVSARGGVPLAGGAAIGPLLRELRGGAPVAVLAGRLPGLTERGYRLVAGNRGRLSRLVPAGAVARADELVRSRED